MNTYKFHVPVRIEYELLDIDADTLDDAVDTLLDSVPLTRQLNLYSYYEGIPIDSNGLLDEPEDLSITEAL